MSSAYTTVELFLTPLVAGLSTPVVNTCCGHPLRTHAALISIGFWFRTYHRWPCLGLKPKIEKKLHWWAKYLHWLLIWVVLTVLRIQVVICSVCSSSRPTYTMHLPSNVASSFATAVLLDWPLRRMLSWEIYGICTCILLPATGFEMTRM